ncbi:MAG: hypothetical protein COA79_26080 [Planctomycetota bacterium]|nr:MAG: hypothetical protein COA79_26080 [Planctomycetota bacterium]
MPENATNQKYIIQLLGREKVWGYPRVGDRLWLVMDEVGYFPCQDLGSAKKFAATEEAEEYAGWFNKKNGFAGGHKLRLVEPFPHPQYKGMTAWKLYDEIDYSTEELNLEP